MKTYCAAKVLSYLLLQKCSLESALLFNAPKMKTYCAAKVLSLIYSIDFRNLLE